MPGRVTEGERRWLCLLYPYLAVRLVRPPRQILPMRRRSRRPALGQRRRRPPFSGRRSPAPCPQNSQGQGTVGWDCFPSGRSLSRVLSHQPRSGLEGLSPPTRNLRRRRSPHEPEEPSPPEDPRPPKRLNSPPSKLPPTRGPATGRQNGRRTILMTSNASLPHLAKRANNRTLP
jgi:hypothetical protein